MRKYLILSLGCIDRRYLWGNIPFIPFSTDKTGGFIYRVSLLPHLSKLRCHIFDCVTLGKPNSYLTEKNIRLFPWVASTFRHLRTLAKVFCIFLGVRVWGGGCKGRWRGFIPIIIPFYCTHRHWSCQNRVPRAAVETRTFSNFYNRRLKDCTCVYPSLRRFRLRFSISPYDILSAFSRYDSQLAAARYRGLALPVIPHGKYRMLWERFLVEWVSSALEHAPAKVRKIDEPRREREKERRGRRMENIFYLHPKCRWTLKMFAPHIFQTFLDISRKLYRVTFSSNFSRLTYCSHDFSN